MKNLLTNLLIIFSETFGRVGAFLLTKYNRNYFFLLFAGMGILTIIDKFKPIPILVMVIVCSVVIILTLGKDIGKIIENKENENSKN